MGKAGHLSGRKHRSRLMVTMPTAAVKGKELWCEVCKKSFSTQGWNGHLLGQGHRAKAAAIHATIPKQATAAVKSFYCEVCKTHESLMGKGAHLLSKKHKTNAAAGDVAAATAPPPAVEGGDSLYCDICNQTKKLAGWEGHMQSKVHRKVADREQGLVKVEPQPTESIIDNTSTTANTADLFSFRIQRSPNGTETAAPGSSNQVFQNEGTAEENATESFYCDVCEQELNSQKKNRHESAGWYCEVCEKRIHIAWKDDHIQGINHSFRFQLKNIAQSELEQQVGGQVPVITRTNI